MDPNPSAGGAAARTTNALVAIPAGVIRHHFFGSFFIVLLVAAVMSSQIADRRRFAHGELHADVMDRWGAPIVQPAPSVRYVESGSVFNALGALALAEQKVKVDARMNYRKRGLVYFSGFDFDLAASYRVSNPEAKDIDVVFVFPIDLQKNKVLLSDLSFQVNGQAAPIDLGAAGDKLTWTGRVRPGEEVAFAIGYRGRGLDSFTYRLDPGLPVRGFHLAMTVEGGDNYDYADGVISASETRVEDDRVSLVWDFAALESGVPVGVIVPSERSFDRILGTMTARSWASFLVLFAGVAALGAWRGRRLLLSEAYLVAAGYGFFFVLLAYLAAYMSFYLAYVLALLVLGGLLHGYLSRILGREVRRQVALLLGFTLLVPTLAVILEGHTGLIYSLEILVGIAVLMALTQKPEFRGVAQRMLTPEVA